MKYEATVHLINGEVLSILPITQDEADTLYSLVGDKDGGRLNLPCSNDSAYLVSASQVNYITIREAA